MGGAFMSVNLKEVDSVAILTLQDNYVDLVARDDTPMMQRALPVKGMDISNSILAEHGFSAVVTVTIGDQARSMLFDFGFSEHGAAFNAKSLNLDLSGIEALALSHGHLDHTGGMEQLMELVGKKGLDLLLHPSAFRGPRFLKIAENFRFNFPAFTRERPENLGINVVETTDPTPMLDGSLLFLGEIPRKTDFEKGMPNAVYDDADGNEKWDPIEDDTALVANVKGKGLVVLSGCAHSGIVNTVNYAKEVTGVDKVFAIMGGFHLTGDLFKETIPPTVEALKKLNPQYIVPTHCTGRKAAMEVEKAMPDQFLMNMAGTKMTFASQ
jgi:7,8-dihydropterin-6-yl-methyl-4-(beta-D-ribofuranosyl)aminobenzene 5'-phosphate synthase